ncbi:MAG: response regulator [Deltaproteobacteria bacterium]|nr:response regulator [Deltaproteobacteria bacterium]
MKRGKVLIVDDDEDIQEFLSTLLDIEGYNPLLAFNGNMGLDIALVEKPNLIILDVSLPGLNGFETCKRMRSHDILALVPIYILSANSDEKTRRLAFEAGADRFIEKPFENEDLLDMMAKDMKKKGNNSPPPGQG